MTKVKENLPVVDVVDPTVVVLVGGVVDVTDVVSVEEVVVSGVDLDTVVVVSFVVVVGAPVVVGCTDVVVDTVWVVVGPSVSCKSHDKFLLKRSV